MQCIGKTIMLELPDIPSEVVNGGIIIPGERSENVIHYTGIVFTYGTGFSEKELKRLKKEIPIGSKVFFDWKTKENKTKIRINAKWYMILPEDLILGIEVNE